MPDIWASKSLVPTAHSDVPTRWETFPGCCNHDVHKMTHSAESERFVLYGCSILPPWFYLSEAPSPRMTPWMKEARDNTSRGRGLPTLPCLYFSTFQPSQRGFFSVYIHVCEGRERAWARILKLLTSGINFGIFSQKNHHTKNYCFISSTPTIVDSILCIFSIPGINFSPLYTPTEILPLENFVC